MILKINKVHFSYNDNEILKGVDLSLAEKEFSFIIGKSGSGKSTLMKLIYMDKLPKMGDITFDDYCSANIKKREIPLLRRKLGIVFQDYKLLNDRTIYDNLSFVLEVLNCSSKEIKKRVNNALSDIGLLHRRNSYPNELSGGEKQKIAIARAVINDPLMLLADEPTGNLDPETTEDIMEIFKKINKKGTAILFATHNYELLKQANGKIYLLEEGKITAVKAKGSAN